MTMCGICGYLHLDHERPAERPFLEAMTQTITHRGPDAHGYYANKAAGLGFRRLSIIDLTHGDQPIYNEDETIVVICNGEIFNYKELRNELIQAGHRFRTGSDVEVLVHLYETYGIHFLNKLNGQFAFAIYDENKRRLFLARDHFGIAPLHYTIVDNTFIFGSEIKSILAHPLVTREVDLVGLDQILSFPGLVSPRTIFKGINSLAGGHYIVVEAGQVHITEYWDLDYPQAGELSYQADESYYVEKLEALLRRSVQYRLQADVPVGFYLSGGLDSSLIAALINQLTSGGRHAFSINFINEDMNEARYQRLMQARLNAINHEIPFDWSQISNRLEKAIYHAECPLKETYNTASLALSEAAKAHGIPVVLTGEGADEWFAGYVGYRFDRFRNGNGRTAYDLETLLEDELRQKLWGNNHLFYEKDYYAFAETKRALYAPALNEQFNTFNCYNFALINKERIAGRHPIHQRSYLDFKLRMSDHLLSDHGDRMALANSVEARYPFLDIDLVRFICEIPPHLKLNAFIEKYILKKVAEKHIPSEIVQREKFAFVAPGSTYLLQQNIDWVQELLSPEYIQRAGYFNPATVERLKQQYTADGFHLNLPFESDLLIIILTFGLFLEVFDMPYLN